MTRARDLADSADKDISGTLTVDDLTASGDVSVGGNLSVSGTTTTIDSANAQTVDLGDNDKIRLGDGDDLQIYHDGSSSLITDTGTGNLTLTGSSEVTIENAARSQYMLRATDGGDVKLFHNGSEKIATTSSGVDVTGTLTADDITLSDADTPTITLTDTTNTLSTILQSGNSTAIFGTTTNHDLRIYTNNTERMRIDSSGNVGIGTTSPNDKIDISGSTGDGYRLTDGTHTAVFRSISGGAILKTASNHALLFGTNDTERGRITSGGDILIGTLDQNLFNETSGGETGHHFRNDGRIYNTTDNNTNIIFNRCGTDGNYIQFRKDGTTTGGIGVRNGDFIYIANADSDGFALQDNAFRPSSDTGSNQDNAIDLGTTASRFKDLYLSGGAYIGGTGAANKLDDYEEGTWTPDLLINGSTSGISYQASGRSGAYVKIGEFVFVEGDIQLSDKGSNSGAVTIGSLPFLVDDRTSGTSLDGGSGVCSFQANTSGLHSPITLVGRGGTGNIDMRCQTASTGDISSALGNTNILDAFSIRFSLTYRTG